MVGVSTGEGGERRSEGLNTRMRRKKNSWLEEMRGWGGATGSGAWIDGERNEEGRYCLVVGGAAAGSNTARRLTTAKQPRSGKEKRRDRWRPGHIHLALRSVAPGGCWEMKNCAALIRLRYRTSDYTCLTLVPKKWKKKKGNAHDLINYAIMWYLLWLWYMGNILTKAGWVISSMFHCLTAKKCFNIKGQPSLIFILNAVLC